MKTPKASIATLVIVIIVITVSAVLGVVGSIAYRYYSEQKWADFQDALNLDANQFAIGLAPAAWNLEYPQVSKLMESLMQDPRYTGIVVDLETKRFVIARDKQGAVESQEADFPTDGLIPTERKVMFSDQQVGQIRTYATPRYIENELGKAFALMATLVLLLDVILTLALYFSLQKLVLKPLRTVERYADEVAHGGAATTPLGNPSFVGELEALTHSIDAMVRQLAMRNNDLQQSTERFQSVIRLLPVPLCLYDEAGNTVFLNDRFTATFGYALADMPHVDHWFAKAYPDARYRQEVLTNWGREVEEAQRLDRPIHALTYDVRCLDGRIKHVEIGGILTTNVNIAVLNDVTERTVAERELARYREHLEELVTMRTAELAKTYQRLEETQFAMDHAGIGIVWIDAHDGHFLYVNDHAGQLCGRSASELQGMHVIKVATEFTPERLREMADDLLDKGFARIETTISHANGSRLPIETSLYFKPPSEERPGHYIAFLTDITQRKATEAALIQAKMAAETAAQARSEFLANMSHEIRTPMNAIIGMSQLALQTDLDKKQRNYIEKVNLSAGSLLGILNDILDFSKVEAGRLDIEHLAFPLERVFDNLANLLALKAEEKGLELIFDISPETPTQLIGDPMRLGQILINLAGNAVKFTNQGTVVVACSAEKSGQQAQLKFSVRDSGIGMSEAQMGALFAPFQQGDNSISRRYGGTGLGLAICKRLAELMGGSISVSSQLGQGSTFTFTAPFGIPEGSGNNIRLPETLRGERVLVVDDNPESLEVLCNLVERFGMTVDRASSAQEALPLVQGPFRYRLLLCDWKMPGMDGIDMIRTMSVTPGAQLPSIIIMVSAYGVDELRRNTAHLPLAGILTKPVSPSSVLDILLTATGQSAAGPSEAPKPFVNAGTLIGTRILLVEDNAINQELAHELLASEGAAVTVANNGQEALDKLDDGQFDCILMDVQMPVMDGLAATRAIRAMERFRDLPIIAMTAGALPSEREQTLLAGMNDHVTKPIDVEVLFNVIRCNIKRPAPALLAEQKAAPSNLSDSQPPVLDVARGVAALNGNHAAYRRILKAFLDNGATALGNLEHAAAAQDLSAIAALAHTQKGSAGTMGATALQRVAQRLDEAARHPADATKLPTLISDFAQIWRLTVEAAHRNLAAEDDAVHTVAAGATGHQDLIGALGRLHSQLLADDTDALETLDGISADRIPPALSGEFSNLSRHVTKYQFDAALLNLERILNSRELSAASDTQLSRFPDDYTQS